MDAINLSTQIRKSYTYLILFYDGNFYYGVRLCPKGMTPWQDTEYTGSPITHRDKWNKVKFVKFILEVFDDYKLAQEKEKQLIKPSLNNPNCLNEHAGRILSIDSLSKGGRVAGKKAVESGQLASIRSKENARKGGKIAGKKAIESGQIQELGKKWGKIAGKKAVESGQLASVASKGGKIVGKKQGRKNVESGHLDRIRKIKYKYKCLVTGFISNAGSLSRYQKARGINTKLRERIL